MAFEPARLARGAMAGAVAAGVWAALRPIDSRLLRDGHDDVAMLGKAFTRGRGWPVVGAVVHVANGAAFGAAYAHVAPHIPLPSWARGPAAALTEHVATWPAVGVAAQLHPARDELPGMASPRSFAASAWRHLVFGLVLGELERRLNAPPGHPLPFPDEHHASTNGHGNLHAAMTGGN